MPTGQKFLVLSVCPGDPVARQSYHTHYTTLGLSKKEQEESSSVSCCIMDAVWYVIFRFCRYGH